MTYLNQFKISEEDMITLNEVNENNLDGLISMWEELDDDQKRAVAPNVVSLAEAYISEGLAWPRVVYLNDTPIGFVMLRLKLSDIKNEDQPAYYLWRMMISKAHQHQGYGKQVIDKIIKKCQEDHQKYLYVSTTTHAPMPLTFYLSCGFENTNEILDDELILKMKIN